MIIVDLKCYRRTGWILNRLLLLHLHACRCNPSNKIANFFIVFGNRSLLSFQLIIWKLRNLSNFLTWLLISITILSSTVSSFHHCFNHWIICSYNKPFIVHGKSFCLLQSPTTSSVYPSYFEEVLWIYQVDTKRDHFLSLDPFHFRFG